MEVYDYARYVIVNMHRASISNALNISNKFEDTYKFDDFLLNLQKAAKDINQESTVLSNDCLVDILSCINKSLKLYKSPIKYSKIFIIDDFIISIWKILNNGD